MRVHPAPALLQRRTSPVAPVAPVARGSLGERPDPRERRERPVREPIVVHVPVPRGPCGAPAAVREAYRLESPRRAVDLYL